MPDFIPLLLVFGVAFLGHLTLMIAIHNYFYGQNLPHGVSKLVHLSFALLILAGPIVLYSTTGCIDVRPFFQPVEPAGWVLAVYLVACLVMALVVFPTITVLRYRRREPAVQIECRRQVVDLERELGFKPVGTGRVGPLPYLPGNEIFTLELVERTLRLPRLPKALDGLKILHLTDLHLCGVPDKEWWRAVIDHCQHWQPDLVCVTGDIVETIAHHGWVMPTLGWLKPRLGAYAILGNHDQWSQPEQTRRVMAQAGFQMLGGRSLVLDIQGTPLVLIGNEQPWFGPTPDLRTIPADAFRLALSHTPDNLPWARENAIDLMLVGHVHGGQIRFPLVGSLLVPSKYGRRYDCGLFHEGPTVMYVGRGLGGDHAVRYGCRPEATLLILRSAEVLP